MSNLVEEAVSKVLTREARKPGMTAAGTDLTKLDLHGYFKKTGSWGDKSNDDILGELKDNYYGGYDDEVVKNLTELYKKDKNPAVKKELDLFKKIAALKSKSMLGAYL